MRLNKVYVEPKLEQSSRSNKISYALESEDLDCLYKENQNDTDKALDLSVSMDDLHVVMNKIEEPTSTDLALMQIVANSAVSGTDIDAAQALPSMESFGEKEVFVQGLVERSGDILNMFVHQVSDNFENLINCISSIGVMLKENKATISDLAEKFPIPSGEAQDIPRTVTIELKDCQVLLTPVGIALTQGDIINALNVTIDGFKDFTKVSTPVGNRLIKTIREVIPQKDISSAQELFDAAKFSNKNLHESIVDMWANMVSKSNLTTQRADAGYEEASTATMLGSQVMSLCVKVNPINTPDTYTTLQERSEVIRSLCCKMQSSIEKIDANQTLTISGVTNAGLRSIIEKISVFITNIEKYASWAKSTAQIAQSQCSSDVVSINNFFGKEATGQMTQEQSDDYRNYLQTHIGDINAVIKTTANMSLLPLKYTNKLTGDFIIMLGTISSYSPVGSYNSL